MRDKRLLLLSQGILLIFSVALYLYKPFTAEDFVSLNAFVRYARSFGMIMPIVVFVITVIQAIIPLIPFVLLCSANGLFFGIIPGSIFTLVASLTGASIFFFTARALGYNWAEKMVQKYKIQQTGILDREQGFLTVLLLRLIPVMPSPFINIGAGVSNISFSSFLLASLLGKIPFILGYTILGYNLIKTKNLTYAIAIAAFLLIMSWLGFRMKKKTSSETLRKESETSEKVD